MIAPTAGEAEVYALLAHAARTGAVCPTNQSIGRRLGYTERTASKKIHSLCQKRLIEVESDRVSGRVVTLPALKLSTATGRARSPVEEEPQTLAAMTEAVTAAQACRQLLRRMLETGHHYFREGQEDQMASALREAGMVPA